jgi:G3E family GTPase
MSCRTAKIVRSTRGQVDVEDILDTHSFSFESAQESPGWLAELNSFENSHDSHEGSASPPLSEADKYGLSSFVFYARRPFHPQRLMNLALSTNWEGVLRTKGFFWLASRHDVMGIWQSAGGSWQGEPGGLWVAAQADTNGEDFRGEKSWDSKWGDRCQQIVWIGVGMDRTSIESMLNKCLLTDKEMEMGPEAWTSFEDPLPPWEYEDHDHDHDDDFEDEDEDSN